nr:hypothetical protein [Tanacetum cinerariifolium]
HLIHDDDNIKELQEDDNNAEANCHDYYNIEELNGSNIHGDACTSTTDDTFEDMENENLYNYEDVLVKDEETGVVYIATDLLADKLYDITTETNVYTIREISDLIVEYHIRAPKTNNRLSYVYRLNPLYKASKDPLKTNGLKFPYGVFQVDTDTRPTTTRGKCLFRFKEPKVLQFVYCVNHSDKSHPSYLKVKNLRILMFRTDKQNSGESPELISLQDAVSQGIVSNQVVAYFVGTVYEFYKSIGMGQKLRDYIHADFIKRFLIKKIDERRKIDFYITDKQREHQFADAVHSCKPLSPTKENVSFRP